MPAEPSPEAIAHYQRGNAHKDAGEPQAALKSYNQALDLHPGYAHALCNRGVVLAALRRLDEALASYDEALALDPEDAITHYNRAVLLHERKDWSGALQSYRRAIECDPKRFHAHFNSGLVQRELQQWDAALASFDRAIEIDPGVAAAHFNRGAMLQQRREFADALQSYQRSIALKPGLYQAFFKCGSVQQELEDYPGALANYDHAVALHRDYPEAWLNRGVVLEQLHRPEEALASYDQALAFSPGYVEAWCNRGTLHRELGRLDEALESFDQALAINGSCAEAWFGRGTALVQQRDTHAAIESYERAISIKPDFAEAQYNRSLALLLAGDYAAGWPAYEWRWKNAARLSMGEPRRFREPLWLGREDLQGRRILVYCEQGLGDTLQFCRYLKLLTDRGAEVIFEVQPPLVDLLARLPGASSILGAGAPLPEFDFQCPLMSLPLALKTTLHSIPAANPYLFADPAKVALWQARLGARKRARIGLVWTGNAAQGNDRNRSIPLGEIIARLPREHDYVALQKEIRPADRDILAANPWLRSFTSELADFSDTAALAATTDLVISVCTSVVHLAGSMGLKAWALLCFDADWRWLLNRNDTPWYPTMALYRQASAGDWSGVFERVAADLDRQFG